jgi:hypothetical protein
MEAFEINLGITNCIPERMTANTIMLCTRTAHLLCFMEDIDIDSYTLTLLASNSAGIVKE